MPAPTIAKLLAHLALPLAARAASSAPYPESFHLAPFASGTPVTPDHLYHQCKTEVHHLGNFSHPASMADCLEIGEWSRANSGLWILSSDNWYILRESGNCALAVQANIPTNIGDGDVADLIDTIHLGDGIRLGSIEEAGSFSGCQNPNVVINFWLRDSKFELLPV
ncbi:hypothetical protein GGR50DRAFT_262122 [Xylaria sp. CBS 124048]|nr:hypothetical protein GGR50DRAFT_262122 [Xylaria sp. CBS 124048]